jgi:hypothetical protein
MPQMKAAWYSKIFVPTHTYQTIHCHILEDGNFHYLNLLTEHEFVLY